MAKHLPFLICRRRRTHKPWSLLLITGSLTFLLGHLSAYALDLSQVPATCEYRHVQERSRCILKETDEEREACQAQALENYKTCTYNHQKTVH